MNPNEPFFSLGYLKGFIEAVEESKNDPNVDVYRLVREAKAHLNVLQAEMELVMIWKNGEPNGDS